MERGERGMRLLNITQVQQYMGISQRRASEIVKKLNQELGISNSFPNVDLREGFSQN